MRVVLWKTPGNSWHPMLPPVGIRPVRVKQKKSVISRIQGDEGLGEAGRDRRGRDEARKAIKKRSHNLGDPQSVASQMEAGPRTMATPMTKMGRRRAWLWVGWRGERASVVASTSPDWVPAPPTSQRWSPAPLLLPFLLLGVGLSEPVTQRQPRHRTVLGHVPS